MSSVIAAALGAAPRDSAPPYDDILPVSRIRAGMRGYGLTVFRGTTIERFEVEVVGVVKNGSLVAPGHDMILVRMTGGPMTTRKANLIRGMSGSPVYVQGRCIGAFSQGEPNSKEPLGGVTPIEDMLEAWDTKLPGEPQAFMGHRNPWTDGRAGHVLRLDRPIVAEGRLIRKVVFDAPKGMKLAARDTLLLRPCSSMVTVSGMHAAARRKLAALLEPYGVEVAQAASGGRTATFAGASMRPGAAFSVMLLTGDVTSGATGTVTYRRGDRILGFGHPFLGVGPLNAPICTAYVHDVYPLLSGSYKISTPGRAIGSLLQDRPFGVSAQIHRVAASIPITVSVEDKTIGRSKTYHMGAASHPSLYAGLVGLAVGSAIADIHSTPGPVTARVETLVEANAIGPIRRTNRVYDARAIDSAITGDLESILSVLATNPFEPLGIQRASVRAVIEPGRGTATIERAFVSAGRYEPGQTVEIGVVVRPFGGAEHVTKVPLRIPERCPDGRLTLTIQGGAPPPVVSLGGIVYRPSTPAPADKAPPTNVRQMIARLLERETGNEIAATLALPSTSVAVGGEPLRSVPPTLDAALRSNRVSAIKTDRDQVRAVIATEWVVSGRHTLILNVQKHVTHELARRAEPQASPSSLGQPPATPTGSSLDADFTFGARQTPAGRSASNPRSVTKASRTQPGKEAGPATPQATEATAPTSRATPDAPIARAARFWRHSSRKDWLDAQLRGVALTSADELRLSRTLTPVCSVPDALVWCVAPDGAGGVYAGTGTGALVVHISADGTQEQVAKLPEVSVHALLRTADGALYAGTAPNGRTYRIGADRKPIVVHDADEPYVLCLASGADGDVLIGTGGGNGSIYRVTASGGSSLIAAGVDEHVLCLRGEHGGLYAGTAGRGMVLRITAGGQPEALFDAPGQSITALVRIANGDLLAATSPRGTLYRLGEDGAWRPYYQSAPSGIAAVVATPRGPTVAAGSNLMELDGAARAIPYDLPPTTEALSVVATQDGAVWVGTANAGQVLRAAPVTGGTSGSLQSQVLDAGATAKWGRVVLSATLPKGTDCRVLTRVGDAAEPDRTWSGWSPVRAGATGAQVVSRPARYLQYCLSLTAEAGAEQPAVREVSISYLPANSEPSVAFQAPTGGERWSGTQTLRWQASDPDKDTLSFELEYSNDGGAGWNKVPDDAVKPSAPKPEAQGAGPAKGAAPAQPPASPRRPLTVAQVTGELDQHPGLPAALREAILERTRKLNAEYEAARGDSPPAKETRPTSARETARTLDTAKLADGVYRFRVTATDGPSNWADARTAVAVSNDTVICNCPPVVYVLAATQRVAADRTASIEFVGVQTTVPLTAAQWRVDDGDWSAAAPADGVADGTLERFAVRTAPLAPGRHTLELRVYNATGLSSTEKVTVDVP